MSAEQVVQALQTLVGQNADFVGEVLFEFCNLRALDGLVAFVLLRAFAAEDLHVHNRAFDSRRAVQRSIANVSGLLAENRAQQFLFRSQRGLALRRHLADKNVAGLHRCANPNHAAFI